MFLEVAVHIILACINIANISYNQESIEQVQPVSDIVNFDGYISIGSDPSLSKTFSDSYNFSLYLQNTKEKYLSMHFGKFGGEIAPSTVLHILQILAKNSNTNVDYRIVFPEEFPVNKELFTVFSNIKAKNIFLNLSRVYWLEKDTPDTHTITYDEIKNLLENTKITGVVDISALQCAEYKLTEKNGNSTSILHNEKRPKIFVNMQRKCDGYEKERKIFQKLTK